MVILTGGKIKHFVTLTGGVGVLYTLPGIDYEKRSVYNLTITASDLGNPTLSSATYVYINITNLPDEVPHFEQDIYEIYIQDSFAVGGVVYPLTAGPGLFTYSLLGA